MLRKRNRHFLPVVVVVVSASVGFAGTILGPRRTRGTYPSIEATGEDRGQEARVGRNVGLRACRVRPKLGRHTERTRRFGLGSLRFDLR